MDGGSSVGRSPWGRQESDMTTERLHFHFSLSCIGEGNGNPLQCSCLENPRDGGAWCAAVYGVAQSRTRLKRLSSSSSSSSSLPRAHSLKYYTKLPPKVLKIRSNVPLDDGARMLGTFHSRISMEEWKEPKFQNQAELGSNLTSASTCVPLGKSLNLEPPWFSKGGHENHLLSNMVWE